MPKLCLYFPKFFEDPVWAGSSFCLDAPDGDHKHGRAGEWVLGRHPAVDITLNIRSISLRHCAISYSYAASRWSVQDLGSTNGTRLNDKLLGPKDLCPLNIGDHLHLGPNRINVVEDEQDTESVGPPTVAATTAIDYRTGEPLAANPAPPPPPPPPEPEPAKADGYDDALYLAVQWLTGGTTLLGKAARFLLAVLLVATTTIVLGLLLFK